MCGSAGPIDATHAEAGDVLENCSLVAYGLKGLDVLCRRASDAMELGDDGDGKPWTVGKLGGQKSL